MDRKDDKQVRDIYARCHPAVPARPEHWYWAYPTLVAVQAQTIVGFTSFSLSPGPTGVLTLFGNDLCVTPAWQRRGIGWALAQARMDAGRALGAKGFIGITASDNTPVRRIFERQGLHACQCLPGYFGGRDGIVWAGELEP